MRNRKMQLKYKCQKLEEGTKPEDINDMHWKKIVQLTKKTTKNQALSTRSPSIVKGKNQITEDHWHKELKFEDLEGIDFDSSKKSLKFLPLPGASAASQEDDVDVQIHNLKSQLLRLESSRKAKQLSSEKFPEIPIKLTQEKSSVLEVCRATQSMKENLLLHSASVDLKSTISTKTNEKSQKQILKGDCVYEIEKGSALTGQIRQGGRNVLQDVSNVNSVQMECGDVISMATVTEGKQEDIGEGILMGLAGSKLYRKVIPHGWWSIKVSSYSPSKGSEACPFPSGWKDHVKYKIVRDAEGRIILWPETLIHI